jgi:hypothetical protein
LDVPISTHGGLSMPALGLDLLGNFTIAHTLEHPFAQMRQFVSLMFEGIFELFRKFLAWLHRVRRRLAPMMDRMTRSRSAWPLFAALRAFESPVSTSSKGNIFCRRSRRVCATSAGVANENALIWPRLSSRARSTRLQPRYPNLINRKDVSDDLKRKIFWDNPLRFYPRLRDRVETGKTAVRAAAG